MSTATAGCGAEALPEPGAALVQVERDTLVYLLDQARIAQAQLEDCARFARAGMHDKAAQTLRDTAARLGTATTQVRRCVA